MTDQPNSRIIPEAYSRRMKDKLRNELENLFGREWAAKVAEQPEVNVKRDSVTRIFRENRHNVAVMRACERLVHDMKIEEAQRMKDLER